MDETRTGSRRASRPLAGETAGDVGRHPGSKRLIAYRQGTLPATEREQVQEHLSSCVRCTRLLLELRDFEAAAAHGEPGPDPLRQEAWESLVRRLPAETPAVRPIAEAARPGVPPRRRFLPLAFGAAAALLLAAVGLALWSTVTVRQERQRLALLERQLEERDAALAALEGSLAEARRQLAARGQSQDLEKQQLEQKVAELTTALAELRRAAKAREGRLPAAPAPKLEIAPRFALRGHEAPAVGLLRAGGVVNLVQAPRPGDRLIVAFRLDDHPAYDEYLIEFLDREGRVLWGAHRRGSGFLGDAGTSVSLSRLAPGRYRLRIEGQLPERDELLGEYILEVEPR